MEQSIINKIKKLQEKAESAKQIGSLAEADMFFKKVQNLLLKYNYSLENVLNHKTKEEIEYLQGIENGFVYYENPSEGFYWEPVLMHSICRNNNVYSYKTKYSDQTWYRKHNMLPYMTLVGTKSNKEICLYFYDIARKIIRDLSVKSYNERVIQLRERYSVDAIDSEEAYYNLMENLSDWLSSPMNVLSSLYPEKVLLLKTLQKLVRYNQHTNIFMPKSYKESDLADVQVWMLKDLVKTNLITNRTTYIQSYLLGAANGVYYALEDQKKSFVSELKVEEKEQIMSLIHVKEDELNVFVKNDDTLKNMTTTTAYRGDANAYLKGQQDGSNLSLNHGLNKGTGDFIKSLK